MIPPDRPKPRTYIQILLSRRGRIILTVLLLLSVIFMATTWWMVSVAPGNHSGPADSYGVEIEVPFSSEQPVAIAMAHDFHLVSMRGALFIGYFYVDGPDPANYTINITDSTGKLVNSINGQVQAPEEYGFTMGQRDATATVETKEYVHLPPGRYKLTFESDVAFRYQVVQKSIYDKTLVYFGLAGAICSLLIFLDASIAYRTWDRENHPPVVAVTSMYFPPPALYPPPVSTLPYQDAGYHPSPTIFAATDVQYTGYTQPAPGTPPCRYCDAYLAPTSPICPNCGRKN